MYPIRTKSEILDLQESALKEIRSNNIKQYLSLFFQFIIVCSILPFISSLNEDGQSIHAYQNLFAMTTLIYFLCLYLSLEYSGQFIQAKKRYKELSFIDAEIKNINRINEIKLIPEANNFLKVIQNQKRMITNEELNFLFTLEKDKKEKELKHYFNVC